MQTFKTVTVVILGLCLAAIALFTRELLRTKAQLRNVVDVAHYNEMVLAQHTNAQIILALSTRVHEQKALLLALTQAQAQNNVQNQATLETITNICLKSAETENMTAEHRAALQTYERDLQLLEERQTQTQNKTSAKVQALEKAVIKLSLAVQENQFNAGIVAGKSPSITPSAVSTTPLIISNAPGNILLSSDRFDTGAIPPVQSPTR